MKNIVLSLVLSCFGFSSLALAKIENKPERMTAFTEEEIAYEAAQAISEHFSCDLDGKVLKNFDAKFVMKKKEELEEQYAEYPGQLTAFVLEVTFDLPAQCKESGKQKCKLAFNLYEEGDTFDDESGSMSCKAI